MRVAKSVRESIIAVPGSKYLFQLLEGGTSSNSAKPAFKWLLTGEYTEDILTTGQCTPEDVEKPALVYGIILAVIHYSESKVKESVSEVIGKIVSKPEILAKIKTTEVPELPLISHLAKSLTSECSLPDGYIQDFILDPDAIEGIVLRDLEYMNNIGS